MPIKKALLAALVALCVATSLLAFVNCSSTREPEAVIVNGPDATVTHEPHKLSAFNTSPTGFGVYGSGSTSGVPALAAINGDSGFVLTSNGTGATPTFQPAVSGSTPGGDLDGGASTQYVVGWDNKALDPTTFRSPATSATPYFNGTSWFTSVPALTGDTTGTFASNSVATTTATCTGNNAYDYDDAGGHTCTVAQETVFCDPTTKGCGKSTMRKASFTDNSTWVSIGQYKPAARSSAVYEWEYVVQEQADTIDAGVADVSSCHLIYLVTTSNGGNITLQAQFGQGAPGTTVSLVPQSCTGILADAQASTTTFTFQVTVVGSGTIVDLQGRGISGKTYDGSFALTHILRL